MQISEPEGREAALLFDLMMRFQLGLVVREDGSYEFP